MAKPTSSAKTSLEELHDDNDDVEYEMLKAPAAAAATAATTTTTNIISSSSGSFDELNQSTLLQNVCPNKEERQDADFSIKRKMKKSSKRNKSSINNDISDKAAVVDVDDDHHDVVSILRKFNQSPRSQTDKNKPNIKLTT